MKKWKLLIDCVLLCCLISLVACRFAPFGSYDDSSDYSAASTIAGFTPEQIQQVVEDIKNNKATLPVSLAVPAYSFYRFDYSNAAGGHRGSTILSYDQAIASPPYGVETTARVLIYESMKTRAGYSFDYFAFSNSLSKERIGPVINAIAAQFADTEFLLNSKQNIGSTTLVVQAIDGLVNGLSMPEKADFVPTPIASPAVDLNLRPDFSDLPVTTLTSLFLNEDLHNMYASMTVVGLANYSLFTSNVQAVSQPRPSFRLHKTDKDHDITTNYRVSLAPISVDGSVTVNLASPSISIPGVASAQMALSSSGDNQRLLFTYSGDRAVAQVLTADSEKLILAFTYRDLWENNCESSKRKSEGPIVYLNMAGPQKFAGESQGFTTPVTKLLCVVIVDNQPIATFTAEQGVPASVDLAIPAGRVATLSCSIIPPAIEIAEASAKAFLLKTLASESRPLDELETASWKNACDASTSVELPDLGRSIFVPTMFKTWFRPLGTYVYLNDPREFTPQVFREVAAPVSPSITMDLSRYSQAPLYAFSIPICPAPAIAGVTTGSFNTVKTFSIQSVDLKTCEYSLDNGATWKDYSGPVAISAAGLYQIIARDKSTNFTSAVVAVTIDTTAPLAPTITGLTSGNLAPNQTFTVTGAEPGGTLYYSFDNGLTSAIYTGPVTISQEGAVSYTAWQVDVAGNTGAKAAPVTVTIDTTAPQAPTISGIASGSFAVNQIFTVSGAEPGGTLYYSLDNGLTNALYTGPVTISREGTATCTAWQIDVAGNVGVKAAPVVVIIDTTAPLAPTIAGINAGIFKTNQSFTVSGAEPGGTLYYSLDNGLTNAIYTGPVTISQEGTATCTAWQVDVAGNAGAKAAPIAVTIDLTAPAAPTITGINTGTFTANQSFTITGAEAGGTLYYSLDNGLTSNVYTGPVTISQEGTVTCIAWQIGAAGKTGVKTSPVTVTVDTTAPQAPTIVGISAGIYTTNQTFTVTGAEPGGTLYYSLDNSLTSTVYTGPVTISQEGTAICLAWQTDVAGNAGAKSAPISVTKDSTAPQAPTMTGIVAGVYTTSRILTVTGAEPGGTLYYSLDDGLTNTAYTGPVTISQQGTATCTAWQIDAVGNTGAKAAPIVVTIVSAAVTALQPASGINNGVLNNVQITGTGFVSGVTPYLTRSGMTPVTGSSVVVNSSTSLTCSFDLTSLAVGSWSVFVTYADGGVATGTDLFQIQSKTWRKSLGGSLNDSDIYCVNAVDGGVLLAGTTFSNLGQESYVSGASDIWVAKLDDVGTLLWSKCIGGSGMDQCSGLIALGNGYVLSGDTTSMDGIFSDINISSGQKALLLKIDVNGDLDSTTLGVCAPSSVQNYLVSGDARGGVKATSDGGCVMAGTCSDGSYGYAWIVKFDSAFSQEWDVRLACNSGNAYALDVAQKTDGKYLLSGYTEFGAGSFSNRGYVAMKDGFVAEISGGEILNLRCFGGTGDDSCTGVVPLSNGDFYVIGTTGSTNATATCPLPSGRGTADAMVFKVSADFATTSMPRALGGSGIDTGLRGKLDADGGLLFSGQTTSTDGDVSGNHGASSDFWLGKVSSGGSLQWQKCFGGTADDYISSFMTTSDGDYLLSGYGRSTDGDLADTGHQSGNDDFVVIRETIIPPQMPQ